MGALGRPMKIVGPQPERVQTVLLAQGRVCQPPEAPASNACWPCCCDGYLAKPIASAVLRDTLARYLSASGNLADF